MVPATKIMPKKSSKLLSESYQTEAAYFLLALGPEDSSLPSTIEIRRANRRRQNRESAVRSRARKAAGTQALEGKVKQLTVVNATMREEIVRLGTDIAMMEEELDGYRCWLATTAKH